VQVLVLSRGWLTSPHCARSHVVDKLVMPHIEPMLVTLQEECDFSPFELSIRVAEFTGAVVFALCGLYPLGVPLEPGLLYLGLDLLHVVFAQTTILEVIGKCMKVGAARLQRAHHGAHSIDDLTVAVGGQSANLVAEPRAVVIVPTFRNFWREGHDSSPATFPVRTHLAPPVRSVAIGAWEELTVACCLNDVQGAIGPKLRAFSVERHEEMQPFTGIGVRHREQRGIGDVFKYA